MDPVHRRRVLTALLDNALKYTPAGGCVSLECQVREGLCLRVTDTGVGIAPEHLHRIFDRFYRVDRVRSEMLEGVGLGLPIARMLTELYGGRITVDSDLGRGTAFTVRFPAALVSAFGARTAATWYRGDGTPALSRGAEAEDGGGVVGLAGLQHR